MYVLCLGDLDLHARRVLLDVFTEHLAFAATLADQRDDLVSLSLLGVNGRPVFPVCADLISGRGM